MEWGGTCAGDVNPPHSFIGSVNTSQKVMNKYDLRGQMSKED